MACVLSLSLVFLLFYSTFDILSMGIPNHLLEFISLVSKKKIIETIFENKHITTSKWWCWKCDQHNDDVYKCGTKNVREIESESDMHTKWMTFNAVSKACNIFYVVRLFFFLLFFCSIANDHFHIQFSLFRIWFAEFSFLWYAEVTSSKQWIRSEIYTRSA